MSISFALEFGETEQRTFDSNGSLSVGGIAHSRLDIFAPQFGVGIEETGLGGALAQFAQDQFDRDARSANHGLSEQMQKEVYSA
ncbi:MAG TPA: hypothetical protein VNZ26_05595 [Vicinamibacterales bacterium]|nr:hypothetical protein [Vicinamibacterales bacterium]